MRHFWLGLLLATLVGVFYGWLYGPEWLESWNETNQQVVEQQKREGAEVGNKPISKAVYQRHYSVWKAVMSPNIAVL